MNDITTFIAYDFSIAGGLTDTLDVVSRKPNKQGHIVNWPGAPEGRAQGSIWRTVVSPEIERSDRLIAFADLANANVGFEVGYALGLGKLVALARVRANLPSWLDKPPFNGFLVEQADTPDAIRSIVHRDDKGWVSPPSPPNTGDGVLFLCPLRTGAAYIEEAPDNWRQLEKEGWELGDLTEILTGIRDVVWVIAPHHDPSTRDGDENAALSVIAGYVSGCADINLHVFAHKEARSVADVVSQRKSFGSGQELTKLLSTLDTTLQTHAEQKTKIEIDFVRPDVGPLPEILDADIIEDRFIGRQLQMDDFIHALNGLSMRHIGNQIPNSSDVQVMWFHGFGGMGKSWFLRHAAIQAQIHEPALKIAIIDWDSHRLRKPLEREPIVPVQLFDPIAYRLAQLATVADLDPYWEAKKRIDTKSKDHRQLKDRFKAQLDIVSRGESPDVDLRQLLNERRLWNVDQAKQHKAIENLQNNPQEHENIFDAWCRLSGRVVSEDVEAVIRPNYVLMQGLQSAIRQLATEAPFLILLDTCEMLNHTLIRWLRYLVAPLCDGQTAIMLLIGSRMAPDIEVPPGRREGWRAEIASQRFRPVAFDEHIYFTVSNIAEALSKLHRPAPDLPELPERLHAVSRGVPLPLRALLDLHEKGDNVLQTFKVLMSMRLCRM